MYYMVLNQELYHHGIKGQKWGVRRYENEDGTLTAEGKDRYSKKQFNRDKGVYGTMTAKRLQRKMQDPNQSIQGLRSKEAERIAAFRKAAKIGGWVGAAGGAVGGYFAGKAFEEHAARPLSKKMETKAFWMQYNTPRSRGHNYTSTILGKGSGIVSLMANTGLFKYGTAALGSATGKPITEAAIMAIGGYSPKKLKDNGGF